jgi:DNA-binding transcriptional regulator YiaG
VIRTETQYKQAAEMLKALRGQLAAAGHSYRAEGYAGEELKRLLDPLRSHLAQVEEEVETYEKLQRGELSEIGELINLRELGRSLVQLRIAAQLTQRELAKRLGVEESQVSRWERNEYHGITVERASEILDKLGARVRTICEEIGLFA